MKTIYEGYTPTEQRYGDRACFLGANTGAGYVGSPFTPFLEGERLEYIYILKGGAGTGKSSFMKKIASEAAGRGIPVDAYYCGSDHLSLDGIVLGDRVGVVDGTAPHVTEMRYPGLASSLLDLSAFLNGAKLQPHREEIMELGERKTTLYRSAHRYLKAMETVEGEYFDTLCRGVDLRKLTGWVNRTAKMLVPRDRTSSLREKPWVRRMYTCAITMKGTASLEGFSRRAERIFSVNDDLGIAHLLLETLGDACNARSLCVEYGLIPVNGRVRELFLPDIGVLFGVNCGGAAVKTVNARRFIRKEVVADLRGRLKLAQKCMTSMEAETLRLLREAGDAHFALEKINVDAMDFKGLNRYCNRIIGEIMGKFTTC